MTSLKTGKRNEILKKLLLKTEAARLESMNRKERLVIPESKELWFTVVNDFLRKLVDESPFEIAFRGIPISESLNIKYCKHIFSQTPKNFCINRRGNLEEV